MTVPSVRHIGLEDPESRPGGLNRYLADLVAAQIEAHFDAEGVVLGSASSTPTPGLVWAGLKESPLWRRLWMMRRGATRPPLPDVVDVHFALYALGSVLPIIGRLRGRPLVVHFQGPWADESTTEGSGRLNAWAKRVIERAVYRRADRVIVLSRAFEQLVVDRYGVDPERVRRISPGIDAKRFTPGESSDARRRVGIDDSITFVVLAVRRLRNRMGLEVAIEAMSRLARPGSLLVIVGEGPERARLEALASERDAPVRFVGRVSDEQLVTWYRAADVSVVPSVALEGFGLVVLESLACGTPVIASDLEGLRDAVEGFEGANLVTPGSVEELAAALNDVGSESTPSTAVCRDYAEHHGWAEVVRLHGRVYDEVLGHSRPLTVFLGHSAALSGGELALARLLPAMTDDRDVLVILAEQGPLVDRLKGAGVRVEVIAMDEAARSMGRDGVGRGFSQLRQGMAALHYSLRLARRLRQLHPDQVHTNSLKAALYGGMAGRLARVPCVIWHVRDRIAEDYLPGRAVRLVRALARRIPDGVVANSLTTLATLGPLDVPTLVLPSPLDPSICPAASKVRAGPLRVGVLGRLAPWKGQDLFLEAFAEAFATSNVTGTIIGAPLFGEDSFRGELDRSIDRLGLRGKVELVGFTADVAVALAELDVLVHTSRIAEPFGQVVIEGMGAGLCVIAADSGGPAEIITDGVDGLLYQTGSASDLARVLASVAIDGEVRERLGRAGIETARRFRPELLAAELEGFYEIVGRRR